MNCAEVSSPACTWRVLYDIADAWPEWWMPAAGVVFFASGALFFRFRHAKLPAWGFAAKRPWLWNLNAIWMMVFSLFWTAAVAYGVFGSHWAGQRILAAGEATVLEGRVDALVARKSTQLTVNGVAFEYSFHTVTAGYRPATELLRLGQEVRIHYADVRGHRSILRLEVRDE